MSSSQVRVRVGVTVRVRFGVTVRVRVTEFEDPVSSLPLGQGFGQG